MANSKLPIVGLLLIASPRFRNLGEGTERGTYQSRKQREAEQIAKALGRDMDVSFPGVIYESADLHRALASFKAARVDFVFAEFMSWSEDATWIEFLREDVGVPVLFAHIIRKDIGFSNTDAEDDFIEFLSAGGLVGTLEGSGSVGRVKNGQISSVLGGLERVLDETRKFGRAAAARSALRNSKLGLVGNYNELMWSTYVDPYNIFAKLGPTVHFISYSDLASEVLRVPDGDAGAYVKHLRERHSVLPDLDELKFLESARASLALARIAERMNLDIMVLNDVDHALFRAIGLRPGFYPDYFNKNASVLVPEGDMGAGIAAYLLKMFSGKNVNFIEPFYIDSANGTFVAGHAGPNDHCDASIATCVKIARDVRFAKTDYKFAGAPFAWQVFAPGEKTMLHISENNGQFKMICTMVEALECKHFLASYSHGVFRPKLPVANLFEQIIKIGSTQHFVIADGDWRDDLRHLSDMCSIEFHNLN